MMSFKTILISLNGIDHVDHLFTCVRGFMPLRDAHIQGLYVLPAIQIYPTPSMHILPEIYDLQREFFKEHQVKVRQHFENFWKDQGVSWEFLERESPDHTVETGVNTYSRHADLIVLHHNGEASSGPMITRDLTQRIAIEAGRPVLAIPTGYASPSFGKRVMVAWNNSQESTRALFDSFPFLQRADAVEIVSCVASEEEGLEVQNDIPLLLAQLKRHGIEASFHLLSHQGESDGQNLLDRATQSGADLLVMGAYGHSRMREYIFGGTSQFVLSTLPLPVLFSH